MLGAYWEKRKIPIPSWVNYSIKYKYVFSTWNLLIFVSDKLWMQHTYIHLQNKSLRHSGCCYNGMFLATKHKHGKMSSCWTTSAVSETGNAPPQTPYSEVLCILGPAELHERKTDWIKSPYISFSGFPRFWCQTKQYCWICCLTVKWDRLNRLLNPMKHKAQLWPQL